MSADKLRDVEVEVRTGSNDAQPDGDESNSGGPPRALGRYRVVAELGRGSTSIVYLAAIDGRGGFSKLFALKRLRAALAEDPAFVAMFLTEARVGAQLNHPNVVSTLEIEEGDDLPFIVMEYLDGEPFQKVISGARLAFTPLPLHMQLAALSSALEGLGHAHALLGPSGAPLGIVHRDVSPHNVFVTTSGVTKVLDFGFAQTIDSPNTMLSSANRVAYMSPEQADGASVDARADLFAVGLMMWEAATRRRFWSEEASKADILRALRDRDLPANRISALARVSEELRAMLVKATDPDPARRYASAGAFQADLQAVLPRITPERFAIRDLGQRVVSLFASDRARLQKAIDEDREKALMVPVEERAARRDRPMAHTPPAPEAREAVTPSQPLPPFPAPDVSSTPDISSGPLPSFPMPITPTDPVPSYRGSVMPPEAMAPLRSSETDALGQGRNQRRVMAATLAGFVVIGVLVGLAVSQWRTREPAPSGATAAAVSAAPGAENAEKKGPVVEPSTEPTALEPSSASMQAQATSSTAVAPSPGAASEERAVPIPLVRAHGVFSPMRVHVEPDPVRPTDEAAHGTDSATAASRAEASVRMSESRPPAVARPPHPIDSNDPYSP